MRVMRVDTKQAGDTIIEVLLAMSIVGLVIGGAFGLANRAVRTGQAAQERTEALKVAESQLELTKAHLKTGGFNPASIATFCVDPREPAATAAIDATVTGSLCRDTIDGAGNNGLYTIEITENSGTYQVLVTWELINSTTTDRGQVTLFYRVGTL